MKMILNCTICLLSVISLALLDAALVIFIFRAKDYRLGAPSPDTGVQAITAAES